MRHAWVKGHSALTTHSGRHEGGDPIIVFWHEHTACPSTTRQTLFGPHGEGLHGSLDGSSKRKTIKKILL